MVLEVSSGGLEVFCDVLVFFYWFPGDGSRIEMSHPDLGFCVRGYARVAVLMWRVGIIVRLALGQPGYA